ncbi:MAG TPA: 30S ribosomal protein THX [Burkholderiales bacterium]
MGKGDIRTRRGKLFRGTHGKARPKEKKKKQPQAAAPATQPPRRQPSRPSAA